MLSPDGWADGLSATICLLIAVTFGIAITYQARKIRAKLLFLIGINISLVGFFWIGRALDFINILITDYNLINSDNWILMGVLRWILSPTIVLISIYISLELMMPKKKKFLLPMILVLNIIWIILILTNPVYSFKFYETSIPGEFINSVHIDRDSFTMILLYIFQILGIIFCGFGYLMMSFKSKDTKRNKFISLSIGYFLFSIPPFFVTGGLSYFLGRLGMASSFFFFYYGLKEAPVKKEKKRRVKEIKVEDSLFRLYERPLQISEEEVLFHRDRKICLVCKGDVVRVSYICPKCNALYCIKCSEELSNQENMCWVCNDPFDETKPTRPDKIIYKDIKGPKKKA